MPAIGLLPSLASLSCFIHKNNAETAIHDVESRSANLSPTYLRSLWAQLHLVTTTTCT